MYVYEIGAGDGLVKVGWSSNVERRLDALQTGSPVTLRVIAAECCGTDCAAKAREKELHKLLAPHRLRGEWFRLNESDLVVHFSKVSGEISDEFANRLAVYRRIVDSNSAEAVESICKYHGVEGGSKSDLAAFLAVASFDPFSGAIA